MQNLALISLFSPFISFLLASLFAFDKKNVFIAYLCSFLICISAISSLYMLFNNCNFNVNLFEWIGIINLTFGFVIDSLSLIMMSVVGVVASLVHFYSIFYMSDDEGFNKYFAYLGLFVFSMFFLIMSDNFLGLFIGWEGVGLCSWLLIGFWYKNNSYSFAANEAFIMNRIADLAMLLGIFLIYWQVGSLNYEVVFEQTSSLNHFVLVLIGIFLFIGAMGKSAQFPFHTWLADAMAGPTPVSALIHAATMVTAGVYLILRSCGIFDLIPEVGYVIALIGAFVALFAASMALVANDLKKIIAYSTLSQLGYMFVAAGLGAYAIALFHLVTHAFFKSLLFLGAGNVMHAMNNNLDIKKMGGLYKSMKFSAIFMVIGSLALAGIYPFAGFFSKDLILGFAFINFNHGIFLVLLIAALLTAFYSFRLLMLVFFTEQRHNLHPHEASKLALFSMLPLAILAIVLGFFEHDFFSYMSTNFVLIDAQNQMVMILASCASVFGILLAIIAYKKSWFKPSIEQNAIYKLLSNDYYIPKFYHVFLVNKYNSLCSIMKHCEIFIFDNLINSIAKFFVDLAYNLQVKASLSLMLKILVVSFIFLIILVWMVCNA